MNTKMAKINHQTSYEKEIIISNIDYILKLLNKVTEYKSEIFNYEMPSYDYLQKANLYIVKAKVFLGKSYKEETTEEQLKGMLGDYLEIINE